MFVVFCWEILYFFVLDMWVWLIGVKRLVFCLYIGVDGICCKG